MGFLKKAKKAVGKAAKQVGKAVSKGAVDTFNFTNKALAPIQQGNAVLDRLLTGGGWIKKMEDRYVTGKEAYRQQQAENERVFEEQKKYDAEMYEKTKADSLENWTRQNAYNSPAEQMARLRDAGLNPNLMYSQGNVGNAGVIASSDAGSAKLQSAEVPDSAANTMRLIGTVLGILNYGLAREANARANQLLPSQLAAQAADEEYKREMIKVLRGENAYYGHVGINRAMSGPLRLFEEAWHGVSDKARAAKLWSLDLMDDLSDYFVPRRQLRREDWFYDMDRRTWYVPEKKRR